MTIRSAALILAWLPPATAAGAAPPADGADFQVERYAVTLRPDLTTTTVAGVETIELRSAADGLTRLSFTANALRITAATLDGAPVRVAQTEDALVFALPRPLPRHHRATLRFAFGGKPARGLIATPGVVYTSYFACDWMVCRQDVPGDKAQLALDLILPAGAGAVAVGRPGPMTALPGGLVRHAWRSTRPYSPYLYGFAAGRLARRSIRTGQGELTVHDATGTDAGSAALLTQTAPIAAFMADKAGVSLPDRRYAQILVPGDEAQEAAGFSLVGQAGLARERGDPAAAWIVAHELAHQWWGNLVTCATWSELWLNEGVATFMVAAWHERQAGPAAYRRELDRARVRVDRARAAGFDKPLAWPGTYPSLGIRRAVQYSKGALFLATLRETVGDRAFWNGLRRFTRRHAGGTVTSRDFQAAMEQASGRALDPLFATWVYGE